MANGELGKGRKFWAYVIAQILTTGVTCLLIFRADPGEIVALGQVFIGFEMVLTAGYIGFNVYQKKITNGKSA